MRIATLALAGFWLAFSASPAERAAAEVHFTAQMETVHTAHGTPGKAAAQFVLSDDQKKLYYDIQLRDLDLEPVAANRVNANDVTGIHLHFFVGEDVIGPHILNIFGDFGEEDKDAVFDFQNETITGIYDISDATIDPATGQPYFQFFATTTKIIDEWVDDLMADQLYLAVHTKGQNGAALLHGMLVREIPEPAGATLAAVAIGTVVGRRRVRRVPAAGTARPIFGRCRGGRLERRARRAP